MMDSSFEVTATVLLATVTIVLISTLILLIIRLPSTRARGDLTWDSRVLSEWAKYQNLRLRKSPSLDPPSDRRHTGPWSWSLASLMKVSSLRLPIFEYVTTSELPLIFLASPDNTRGPVEGEIWYIDGSTESCKKTRTTLPEHFRRVDSFTGDQSLPRESINSVANGKASWLGLLEMLQQMERDSTDWEIHQWRKVKGVRLENVDMASLAVGVQPYKRAFRGDSRFTRPYATTTISHLVELAAVLGLYWKEFDRNEDKYRAEGNGLSFRGTRTDDIGLVFTFERMGWSNFGEKRVIPTSDVKELCFGNAPTFYRAREPSEDMIWQDTSTTRRQTTLKTLRLGSQQDLSATLALIGCNQETVSRFLNPESKKSHLFPVVFEIMGMLCRRYHLKNRCFTCLPNPTMHFWRRSSLSLRRLLSAFRKNLRAIISEFEKLPPFYVAYFRSIADELDSQLPGEDQQFSPIHLDLLHDALHKIDTVLGERSIPKSVVLDVIRRHLQELLQAINEPANEQEIEQKTEQETDEPSHSRIGSPSFKSLSLLPPEYREHELMRVYFSEIRQRVVGVAYKVAGAGNVGPQNGAADASLEVHLTSIRDAHDSGHVPSTQPDDMICSTDFDATRNTAWCGLVLRTICWLLLHDFDENDVQLPKSELQGSRLPVYIQ
ncbi:hypothetical protein GGR51DRAFT_104635 [Nemania sp. FL0031]|nr:hypothetical protein GGR51DRAFT_104635 [Nemania sp. FL0031]